MHKKLAAQVLEVVSSIPDEANVVFEVGPKASLLETALPKAPPADDGTLTTRHSPHCRRPLPSCIGTRHATMATMSERHCRLDLAL